MSCLDRLKGMYAFSIWSEKDQTLHLVRDPMGIKPLYYWKLPQNQGIVFSSELKAFVDLPGFQKNVNRKALGQYLEFGYTFDECETIFDDVFKLPPGQRIEVKEGVISKQIQHYQAPTNSLASSSQSEIEESLYTTLSEVVKQHLVADVPVGLLLSGGLDSSLIAALASKHEQIHTFSMGFANSNIDERPFAKVVSEHIGSIHQELLIQPTELVQDIGTVAAHYDDLFADWGMISTRLLYKKCKQQGIKVVLVGEGSDELFGGYGIFQHALNSSRKSPLEWRLFQLYRSYAGRRYGVQYLNFRTAMKAYLTQCNGDLFSAIRMFESRNQLPNNYVMKVDKASMSLSLEARTPFLDSRIADIAYQIPRDMLIDSNNEKMILKSMARRYKLLPDEIIDRRKFGAGVASNWMADSTDFRDFARENILSKESWVNELGLRDAMERYFDQGQSGYRLPHAISIFSNLAWRLLILNLWSNSLGVAA